MGEFVEHEPNPSSQNSIAPDRLRSAEPEDGTDHGASKAVRRSLRDILLDGAGHPVEWVSVLIVVVQSCFCAQTRSPRKAGASGVDAPVQAQCSRLLGYAFSCEQSTSH